MDTKVPVSSVSWSAFFNAHAPNYDKNPFAQNTLAEVQFLMQLVPLASGASILDIGCGTGRHAVELAKQGYKVTGVDLSEGMLAVAQTKAAHEGVQVEWVHQDARLISFKEQFDLAICLCEGAVGLLGHEDDPQRHDALIFQAIAKALKPGGSFVLTSLNGYRAIRKFTDQDIADGMFDPRTMVASYYDEFDLPEGKQTVAIRERLFTPPETVKLLEEAGLRTDHVYGGTAGHWGRRPLQMDEMEAMYVCRKV